MPGFKICTICVNNYVDIPIREKNWLTTLDALATKLPPRAFKAILHSWNRKRIIGVREEIVSSFIPYSRNGKNELMA